MQQAWFWELQGLGLIDGKEFYWILRAFWEMIETILSSS